MIFFIHIPKTAGTSLLKWFLDTAGEDAVGWYSPDNSPQKFFSDPAVRTKYRIYGGHIGFTDIVSFLKPNDLIFSVVRDPVERGLSYFNHVANRDPNHPTYKLIHGKRLEDALAASVDFKGDMKNNQCWYLSGTIDFAKTLACVKEHRMTVVPISNMDFLLERVARALGATVIPPLEHHNFAETDYSGMVDDSDRRMLHQMNAEDQKLFRWAKDNAASRDRARKRRLKQQHADL
jgi:hypothetical protein